jgi:hypothetical protein
MDRKPETHALYIVEHPDHLCLFYLVPFEEEEREFRRAREGIWSERLGEISSRSTGFFDASEIHDLVRRCSRPMLLLSDADTEYYLAVDHADRLLAPDGGSRDRLSVPQYNSSTPAFLRFGPHLTELVFPGYEGDAEPRQTLSAPLYMQETIPPVCTLMTDSEYSHGLSEVCWSEKLGYVQAEVDRNDSLNVRLEHINVLVRSCSRQMLLVSGCMPPLYIPRKSLERLVRAYKSGCADYVGELAEAMKYKAARDAAQNGRS